MPQFQSRFTAALPADPELRNQRRQVHRACYSWVRPQGFPEARLLAWSRELGAELGLTPDILGKDRFTAIFAGNEALPGLEPYALCYGGHQFGNWAGQLGDGRAINLGEVLTASGQHQVLQLKGAGPTPYSRGADGLAVLRSSLREFVCSEAMFHLGVPTTRALSLVATNEDVIRDMFYDGHPQAEPGAIVCRAAPTFIRFGSFEILAQRQDHDLLRKLADYTITTDFPALLPGGRKPEPEVYTAWFHEICRRTADLLVHWMRVGFVHGVMNTDNMSILGLTIDYGPYGWLENYDPHWTPNTTDAEGRRYRFGAQPQIALWNLVQLANAVYPLVNAVPPLEAGIELYKQTYERGWLRMMRGKLGLEVEHEDDPLLIQQLLNTFSQAETDMTLFFRFLADVDFAQAPSVIPELLKQAWYEDEPSGEAQLALFEWLERYHKRLQLEERLPHLRKNAMHAVNPLYVPRNYLAQLAIDAATNGDLTRLNEWMEVLKQPYTVQPGKEEYAGKRPEWARQRAGCSMLSCSS